MTLSEKLELERLLLKQGLYTFDGHTNKNYKFLFDAINGQKYDPITKKLVEGVAGVVLEGSSRSGKTWSWIDILIFICLFLEKDCQINIYRSTFEEFKTTLYRDFKRRLDAYGIPNKFHGAERVKSFKIGRNTIHLIGCDKVGKAHGGGCDYAFFNEAMHIPKAIFDQVEMRCQKFWMMDYNPSYTEHWVFNSVIPRANVGYLHSTFKDNPYISPSELNKILSYEPWKPGSYTIKDNTIYYRGQEVTEQHQPPPHPTNIDEGTADEFMWKVYGLGLRGAMEGLVFKQVSYIDEFPEDQPYIYANDFGFTADPNATVKYSEDDDNIWVELLIYTPIETPKILANALDKAGVEKDAVIPCDSSDKYTGENKGTVEMVRGINDLGYKNAFKISKNKSVIFWLLSMKSKKIHIVKNHLYKFAKTEQQMYKFKEINGIFINQPEDKHNHFWDATRYGHMAFNNKKEVWKTEKSLAQMGINY